MMMSPSAEAFLIFEAALGLSDADRHELLETRCAGRAELAAAVEQLLQASIASAGFLEPQTTRQPSALSAPGYRLVRCIGEGGMGQVWLAERSDGVYQQRVAIKFLTADLSDPKMRASALAERQFLANLQHPGIAQIIDAGNNDEDVPYVVMEYIEGEAIERYVHIQKLDFSARVRLFLQVLDAVDGAHRALILHRDLKSANVLVNIAGQAKLLDFGIAKSLAKLPATDLEAASNTAVMLTPASASPEQLEGKSLTVASDIYSAGLLLYRLLTGQSPLAATGSLFERAKQLAQTTLPRASERFDHALLDLAASQSKTWKQHLRGDLDAILAKALRYEPELRYHSAREFADDLQAWLAQRPVQAHSGGRWYRWRKFAARNRLLLASTSAGLLALTFGLTVAWQQAHARALEAEARASEAERARLAFEFLSEMIATSDPSSDSGSLTMAQALDRASADLGTRFVKQPKLEAELRTVLGRAYVQLNDLAKAEVHLSRAETLLRTQQPEASLRLLQCLVALGELRWSNGDLARAESHFREVISANAREDAQKSLQATARGGLAQLLAGDLGKVDEGIALANTNLALWQLDSNDRK